MNSIPYHLTTLQASNLLHCRESTIRSYITDGHLRAIKVGRRWLIDSASLDELLRHGSKS